MLEVISFTEITTSQVDGRLKKWDPLFLHGNSKGCFLGGLKETEAEMNVLRDSSLR